MQPAAHSQHLIEEALKENRVAGFIRDLCGQKDALVLARRRMEQGSKGVGHGLLADEEQGHRVLGDLPDPFRQAQPVGLVLAEVEIGYGPLLLFPAAVKRRGVDVRTDQPVHLAVDLLDRERRLGGHRQLG